MSAAGGGGRGGTGLGGAAEPQRSLPAATKLRVCEACARTPCLALSSVTSPHVLIQPAEENVGLEQLGNATCAKTVFFGVFF